MKRLISFVILIVWISALLVYPADAFAVCRWNDLSKEVVTTSKRLLDISEGSVVFLSGLSAIYAYGEKIEMTDNGKPIEIFEDSGKIYIPASYAAEVFGGKYEYYASADKVYMKFPNFTLHFIPGTNNYSVNSAVYDMQGASVIKDGVCFVASDVLRKNLDMYFYKCTNGMLIASPSPFKIDDTNFNTQANIEAELAKKICFETPDAERIKQDFELHTINNAHPRVIIDAQRKSKLLEWTKSDPDFIRWKENAVSSGNMALTRALPQYTPDGRGTILSVSRDVKSTLMSLAMAYLLTSEQKYADGAWKILETVAQFPDWHPPHFLDVGEMCAGVALAYDWMYDGFSEEQRQVIREAIKKHALTPAMKAYTDPNSAENVYDWTHTTTNWNAVCNGGVAMAALAIAGDDSSELAFETVANSVWSVAYMMKSFAPEGAWFEGVMYWGYTMEFFGFHMASLLSALGNDYGICDAPGLSRTAYYPINMKRPNGSLYRFGDDSNTGGGRTNEYPLLARIFSDSALQKFVNDEIRNGGGGLNTLMYYDPELGESDSYFALDNKYNGLAEIVTMRGSFNDTNAIFAATKAGTTSINHGHFDIGSFVLDSDGVEWFKDGGSADYSWDSRNRYLYYRYRMESHNTVVVNPSNDLELDTASVTPIEFKTKERGAIATLDMTNTYAKNKDVVSAKRGMALINDRTSFLVQDEITTNENGKFVWFGHTKASVTLSDDGKVATLEQNGKKLHVQILSPENGVFTVGKDEPLPTSPKFDFQSTSFYDDVTKLSIHIDNTNNVTYSVVMIPERDGVDISAKIPELTPIDNWTIPDGEIPEVENIFVNGAELLGFDGQSDSCTVYFENVQDFAPEISAESGKYTLNVIQADSVPGVARIEMLESEDVVKTYYVNMAIENSLGLIDGKKKHKVVSIDASAVPESHNPPSALCDNSLETKWAAQGDQWALMDLGEEKTVDSLGVAWSDPGKRITKFEIEISSDGINWNKVYDGKSRGENVPIEMYSFESDVARYVRLNVHGYNSVPGSWNSIFETCVYGPLN